MQNRSFGKTGLSLPPLLFGATSLGNLFRAASDDEKRRIVEQWFAVGISPVVIDSAGKYGAGLSLEVIGRELARLDIPQDKVVISNKLGWRRIPLTTPEPTFEPGAWVGIANDAVQDISYEGILRCYEEGNALLGEYKADLVSVHDPDEYLAAATDPADRQRRMNDLVDAYKALSELRDCGKVVGVGVGSKTWTTVQELSQYCDFDWVMFANSFTIMHHPVDLIEFMETLHSRNIAVINSALFHGGFLLGGDFFDYRRVDPNCAADAARLRYRVLLKEACDSYEVSVFDVGVAFGRSHPGITAIALSSSRADRIPSHCEAIAREIPAKLWDRLRDLHLIAPSYPFLP